jgi:hypothetical protein
MEEETYHFPKKSNQNRTALRDQFPDDSPSIPPVIPPQPPGQRLPEVELKVRQAAILAEWARRQSESLRLYEPLPMQQRFHASDTMIRLLPGSNRAGKTLAAGVEVARAVTGTDPGKKYPLKDGRCFIVGGDLKKHVGQVLYRKLFRPGAFQILRDEKTGLWRAWRPWVPEDMKREHETRPARPLIPKRFIKSITWENKRASIPQLIVLNNGWEMSFFSSLGKPPQGSDIDLAWFDEEIRDPDWVPEMQARIVDRAGYIIWSATPQVGTEHLFDLHEQAIEEEVSKPAERTVEEFNVLIDENKYMTPKKIARFKRSIRNDDEYEIRIKGQFGLRSLLVFPEWRDHLFVDPFEPPPNWSLYLFIDPGRQTAAALFVAVPPPDVDPIGRFLYDEVYIHEADARKLAAAVKAKVGQNAFQAMWVDEQEARKEWAGTGRSLKSLYELELRKAGVRTSDGGCSLLPAPSEARAGREALRSWLTPDEHGITKLRPMRGRVPHLAEEMRRYHNKRSKVGGSYVVMDEPVKKWDHLIDCARYCAAVDPGYRPPPTRRRSSLAVWKYLLAKRKRRRNKLGKAINLGPGD